MAETRIGVDIGRGKAAAVALDAADRVLAQAVGPDIGAALAPFDVRAAELVMLDAGHLASDALDHGDIARVGVVRIGAPFTLAVPPLATWPQALRAAVSAGTAVVAGGAHYDGSAAPLDEAAVARFVEQARPAAVAVTGLFSPIAPEQELAAAAVIRRTLGRDVPISLSHELGTLGLLERENATVLNAALTGVFDEVAAAARAAIPSAEVYLARGDGTLIGLTQALRLPVTALGSGAASALRGAFRLTGIDDAVVAVAERSAIVVGALRDGVPRRSPRGSRIAGVSAELGFPDTRPVRDPSGLAAAVARFVTGARRPVLVVVGGAAERVPDSLAGVGEVIHAPDGEFARAIGAASGIVRGEAERACADRADVRRIAVRDARAAASERAIHLGADPRAVAVVDVEETLLATLPEPAIRIRVRAAGPP